MNTNVIQFNPKANVPDFVKNRTAPSELSTALAGGAGGYGKRVSIKGGVFRLISGGKELAAIDERYLDVVIVAAAPKISRIFYEGTFDEDHIVAPLCWSQDGDKPDPKATKQQCNDCASCPQNIAGSGTGETKACRYQKRMAVVLANDIAGDVLQVVVPAKSIFGKEEGDNRPLQAYAQWLAANNVDPNQVITRMRFDTKEASPKLFFKAMDYVSDEEYAQVLQAGKSADALAAVTMTVAQRDGVKETPTSNAEFESPKPQAPKAEPKVEAGEPPVKRRGRPAKAEAPVQTEPPIDEPVVRRTAPEAPVDASKENALKDVVGKWNR